MTKYLLTTIVFIALFFSSCKDENNTTEYVNGDFIINEGTFGSGNGSISFYDGTSVTQDIFFTANSRALGDVVQDLQFHNGKGYIVVNNSNKIEVVDQKTFIENATISGLELPRFFMAVNNSKAYVSEWGADGVSGKVQIIDLSNNTITGNISTDGGGPEKMAMIGDHIYVGHSGGFGLDSIVSVIDPTNDNVIQTLNPGYNPTDIVEDNNGNVWIMSRGYSVWGTSISVNGRLTAYNPNDFSVVHDFELPGNYPADLKINPNGDKLFLILNGSVVSQDVNSNSLSLNTVSNDRYFYSLGYNMDNNLLYAGDAKDNASRGDVLIYNESGVLQDSLLVGIVPTEFLFGY